MKRAILTAAAGLACLVLTATASAHCQIPCGIYDDELRLQLIVEHAGTIEKSMNQINELAEGSPVDYNQLVRWVENKDDHAQEIQDIVAAYFMTQRVKVPVELKSTVRLKYTQKLQILHQILVTAMKCKQTTDLQYPELLRRQVDEFRRIYFGPEHTHGEREEREHDPKRVDHGRG